MRKIDKIINKAEKETLMKFFQSDFQKVFSWTEKRDKIMDSYVEVLISADEIIHNIHNYDNPVKNIDAKELLNDDYCEFKKTTLKTDKKEEFKQYFDDYEKAVIVLDNIKSRIGSNNNQMCV